MDDFPVGSATNRICSGTTFIYVMDKALGLIRIPNSDNKHILAVLFMARYLVDPSGKSSGIESGVINDCVQKVSIKCRQ